MITTTLIFDRRKKASRTRKGMVEIRITLNRKSYYISTGVRVPSHKWSDGYVVNTFDANEVNDRLRIFLKRANDEANRYIDEGRVIDLAKIKEVVLRSVKGDSDRTDFIDFVRDTIPLLNVTEGTRKHYKSMLLQLTRYNKMLRWQDVTPENLYNWDRWLHELPGAHSRYISDASLYKYHRTLKAMLYRAVVMRKIDRNPYTMMRGQFKRGETENVDYLTEDEMDAIMRLEYKRDSEKEKARNLFVFQLFTGLSYSDMQAFDIRKYKNVNGRWINTGTRIKTGVPYVSELLQPVVEVLQRYDWQIPKITNQAYNRTLKEIGEDAGIDTPLHSHLARHSFATMMLRNGVKIENVSKMLGHTNIKQTQRYAKVLAQSVHDDFEMIAKKIKSKK